MPNEYKVLGIDQLVELDDEGRPQPYYRIRFRTKGGVVLTTNISEEDYTPEKTTVILTEKATDTDKILKG